LLVSMLFLPVDVAETAEPHAIAGSNRPTSTVAWSRTDAGSGSPSATFEDPGAMGALNLPGGQRWPSSASG
jgi:hypothetical protein